MRSPPLISVCVPTYNGEPYLRASLESILKQTLSDLEVLIVDDCSKDETLGIATEYASIDKRIRIVKNERNLGLVGNWNRCIELARGEWVKFVFQDDIIEPLCLEQMVQSGIRTECPFVACRREFIFESVTPSIRKEYEKFTTYVSIDAAMEGKSHLTPEMFCAAVLKYEVKNFIGEPTSVLIRNDVFKRLGCFNPLIIQLCDLEFWLRIGANFGIAYVPETLARFRVHSQSTTSSNSTARRFRKDVIDPLLLRELFASSPQYSSLRAFALEAGTDLNKEFFNALISEQRWGPDANNPEWPAMLSTFPQLRMPVEHRLKKSLRKTIVHIHNMLKPAR